MRKLLGVLFGVLLVMAVACEPLDRDVDGDGYLSSVDCNDNDPAINPDAAEVCGDGIDQNCDESDEYFVTNICTGDYTNPAVNYSVRCSYSRCQIKMHKKQAKMTARIKHKTIIKINNNI